MKTKNASAIPDCTPNAAKKEACITKKHKQEHLELPKTTMQRLLKVILLLENKRNICHTQRINRSP